MSAAVATIRRPSLANGPLLLLSSGLINRLVLSLILISFIIKSSNGALLQGCHFDEGLCDRESGETCVPDGLFGQCYSATEAELLKPLILEEPLNEIQSELLRLELTRLANHGYDWPHSRSQCVLAYFKLSIAYQLDYDTEFCAVRNPASIWQLIQRVQNAIAIEQEREEESSVDDQPANPREVIFPVVLLDDEEQEEGGGLEPSPRQEELYQVVGMPKDARDLAGGTDVTENGIILAERAPPPQEQGEELLLSDQISDGDAVEEEAALREILRQVIKEEEEGEDKKKQSDTDLVDEKEKRALEGDTKLKAVEGDTDLKAVEGDTNLKALNSDQMKQIIDFIESLQDEGAQESRSVSSSPEVAEVIPLTSEVNEQQLMLKKDPEVASNADLGLANTVHKIVKGGIQRVEGNRVYLRVGPNSNLTEDELYKLIAYLDKRIAAPNDLFFDEFLFDEGQLSFRVSRLDSAELDTPEGEKKSDHLESASGVAKAVYKRRKDIQSLAGVDVDETGIGSGEDVVPVEKVDHLFVPILAVCLLTITSLISVLAVHLYKNRKGNDPLNKSYLPQVIDHIEGKASSVYEELCRHRMHAQSDAPPTSVKVVGASKHSSTSSWPEELQTSQLDISTGHVLLSFLQQFLSNPEEISAQWRSVKDYANAEATTVAGSAPENAEKNYNPSIIPYDDSLIQIQGTQPTYINASAIYDSDPKQIAYIATQAPIDSSGADFWQLVWDQGVALIVNLTDQEDIKDGRCLKYWPEEGAKTFGQFETHLVSEHIWSEHYIVRSLYLKNLNTGETRTVTQFHYLAWPVDGCPASIKSLLEFRRKVNKSYRGRASPILVHCTDGAGRTGTYCLLDMVASRILHGVKEVNIAACLEHLRDQRMGMVANEDQFKLVYAGMADEVDNLIKNQQH